MNEEAGEFKWYVAHTQTGYENKVRDNIMKTVENRNLQNLIADACIPMSDVVEVKESGEKKVVSRKTFPGYVFVKMIMTNETWYIVRNTRGCTGFVGPESKPVPLTDTEVYSLGVEKVELNIDFEVGDSVRICEGSMEGFMGEIRAIDKDRLKITVMVTMFGGREMEVEVDLSQVEALE
ncbi:MAG: transcription termination/antitermination protein NusG [Clostridia bacterium]|nr:transcription termination/antitermination protein NusG [Clostridia bacterium]